MALTLVMAIAIVPTAVFAFNASDWQSGDQGGTNYGTIRQNPDGTYTFEGAPDLNTDNSHCGPYTKANAPDLSTGEFTETIDVEINPSQIAAAEKFAVTVSINDTNGNYKTELLANFQKGYNDAVNVAVGLDPTFSAELTEDGIYTLKYRYIDNTGQVCAQF